MRRNGGGLMDVQIGVVGLTTSIVADAKKLIMDAYRMQRSNEYITGDYVPNRSETTSIITDNAPPLEFYQMLRKKAHSLLGVG